MGTQAHGHAQNNAGTHIWMRGRLHVYSERCMFIYRYCWLDWDWHPKSLGAWELQYSNLVLHKYAGLLDVLFSFELVETACSDNPAKLRALFKLPFLRSVSYSWEARPSSRAYSGQRNALWESWTRRTAHKPTPSWRLTGVLKSTDLSGVCAFEKSASLPKWRTAAGCVRELICTQQAVIL